MECAKLLCPLHKFMYKKFTELFLVSLKTGTGEAKRVFFFFVYIRIFLFLFVYFRTSYDASQYCNKAIIMSDDETPRVTQASVSFLARSVTNISMLMECMRSLSSDNIQRSIQIINNNQICNYVTNRQIYLKQWHDLIIFTLHWLGAIACMQNRLQIIQYHITLFWLQR